MSEEVMSEDQSHYEISLTAGQAFVAFVLLLLSLAASFAFGLILGRSQSDERLIVRKEPAVITEGSLVPAKKNDGKIVELGVSADDFKNTKDAAKSGAAPVVTEDATTTSLTETTTSAPSTPASGAPASAAPSVTVTPTPAPHADSHLEAHPSAEPPKSQIREAHPPTKTVATVDTVKVETTKSEASGPYYAQLLSTGDQRTAESLAAKLIDRGFSSAYVERGGGAKGTTYRVRVKFSSEAEAHRAEAKLREFSKEVWITK